MVELPKLDPLSSTDLTVRWTRIALLILKLRNGPPASQEVISSSAVNWSMCEY